MKLALLFPGQGSQFVGMGADLFSVRPDLLGERADEVVGFSLRRVCLEGPEEELTRTEHAQPALFALSYALWEELAGRLGEAGAEVSAAAGHSLGEYTALAAADALSYWDALAVVAERGRAMAAAADAEPSAMAAVIGADYATVDRACASRRQEGGRLWVANLNAPGQVVVAGGAEDVDWLSSGARQLGLRRVVPLAVAGAFHSPFMVPAVPRLSRALSAVAWSEPSFPVYSNVTARPHQPGAVTQALLDQVVSPVRFTETLQEMAAAGVDMFVHVGPGDVTAGLARRTLGDVGVLTVSSTVDVDAVVGAVGSIR